MAKGDVLLSIWSQLQWDGWKLIWIWFVQCGQYFDVGVMFSFWKASKGSIMDVVDPFIKQTVSILRKQHILLRM